MERALVMSGAREGVCSVLRESLEGQGYTVTVAADWAVARKALLEEAFELLVINSVLDRGAADLATLAGKKNTRCFVVVA